MGATSDYDANNRITASAGKAWVYDADGNPVSVNAGLSSEETFTHDAQNRLRSYTSAAASTTASYLSDPLARRIKKTVNGTTTWFLWDGDHLLAEFASSGDRTRRYTYTDGFAPAEQVVVAGSAEDVQEAHADHLDAPRGLSDDSGDAVWRAAYRAFGTTTPDEDPDGDLADVSFAIRFPGQYADPESGVYDNVYRTYRPAIGRYLTADPIGQLEGIVPGSLELSSLAGIRAADLPHEPMTRGDQLNLYVYGGSRPTSAIDPKGLSILFCNRLTDWRYGNHGYLWDTRTNTERPRSCGMQGSFGWGKCGTNEKGPPTDVCREVPGSEGKEDEVLDCCQSSYINKRLWFVGVNDCHTRAAKCLSRAGLSNPGAPGGRFGPRCDAGECPADRGAAGDENDADL